MRSCQCLRNGACGFATVSIGLFCSDGLGDLGVDDIIQTPVAISIFLGHVGETRFIEHSLHSLFKASNANIARVRLTPGLRAIRAARRKVNIGES